VKYYEFDGAIRAQSNRSFLLAGVSALIAVIAIGFAMWVRLQPPTVIYVDKAGKASTVSPASMASPDAASTPVKVATATNAPPTEIEKRAVVRDFLNTYLNYSPATVKERFSTAMNMMTATLSDDVMADIKSKNVIKNMVTRRVTSEFRLTQIESDPEVPNLYTVFGEKTIRFVTQPNGKEQTDSMIGRYKVRLTEVERTEFLPSGLLIAEFGETQIEGKRVETSTKQ
jgi:hypothetical protein